LNSRRPVAQSLTSPKPDVPLPPIRGAERARRRDPARYRHGVTERRPHSWLDQNRASLRRYRPGVGPMWRCTMFLMCLIAALSGTLLRQAEAANDFVRSHSESGPGQVVEMIDGGVGDDSGETILNPGGDTRPLSAAILPAMPDACMTPLVPASSLLDGANRRRAEPLAAIPTGSAQRHAWLQCFQF
jgi:hypothetical protein